MGERKSATEPALVVGAGISGLACAFDLARAGRDVLVVEAKDRAGGVIDTLESGGFRFETGPNTIPAGSRQFRRLCGDLGIADHLIPSRPEAKRRYLLYRGRLRLLPGGPGGFLVTPLLSARGKLRVLSEPFRRHVHVADGIEEPTLEAFLSERVGREATRTLAGAFVRGVYAAELHQLGARSAFPRLWRLANEHGGLVRGLLAQGRGARDRAALPGPRTARTDLLSFSTGLHQLTDALATQLGSRLRTHAPVRGIAPTDAGWSVTLGNGEQLTAGTVVLAVPAPVAHRLLAPIAPTESLVAPLAEIEHAALTVVHLGLDVTRGMEIPPGFGFLVPPEEAPEPNPPGVLGTLFPSNCFPGRAPDGGVAVTSIYRTADLEALSDEGLAERAGNDLRRALHGRGPVAIRFARTQRWTEVIPRYGVGHARRMEVLERDLCTALPGVVLAGSYLGGVSVEDCITRGRNVARRLSGAGNG